VNERSNDDTHPDVDTPPGTAAFVTAARRMLDAGDGALDPLVVARLGAIRRAAVATMEPSSAKVFARWVPASAAACTLLAAGLFAWSVKIPALPVFDDELAQLAAEDMELLDDIEFVAWMVEADVPDAT